MDNLPALWDHQKEAIERAKFLPGYALFFEMGTGKSRTVLEILKTKPRLKTIIFCPPIVVKNWRDEIKKYTDFDLKKVVELTGPGKKRLELFEKHQGLETIFITNYETLLMADVYDAFQKWQPEVLIFDESHKCKEITSKRTKLADKLANPFDQKNKKLLPKPLVYILSGTPILNSLMDLYAQFKILDGGKSLGSNYYAFRARYFRDRNAAMPKQNYFPNWQPMTLAKDGIDAAGELNKIIFEKGMRVEKKDCLTLPPEVHVTIKVGMTAEQARLYKEMKDDFVTFYKSKACVASLAITKALRLMQITSGFVSLENFDPEAESVPSTVELSATPKLAALKELISEITGQGHKIIIWAVWKANYKHIGSVCNELGVRFVEVHGGISEKNKRENIESFKTDPEVMVFVGHPGSAGIGINLVNAKYSIFYSRNFSLEHYLQAKARNYRGGSLEAGHDKITHYNLVVEETIDEAVCEALSNKQAISDTVLGDLIK